MIATTRPRVNREPAKKFYFTVRETAQLLGISESTLRNLAKAGHLTPNRIGAGSIRYSRYSLNQFIEANQSGHAMPPGTDHVAWPLLGIPDAARYLSVSVRTLFDLTQCGAIASLRVGQGRRKPRVLYSVASLNLYVALGGGRTSPVN